MKLRNKFLYIILGTSFALTGCEKLLDRPVLDQIIDQPGSYWRNENDIRLYANGFYTQYFNGNNSSWTVDYTPVRGYTMSDDVTTELGPQANFEQSIPSSRESLSELGAWLPQYAGPTWNFSWVRKVNIFLARLESEGKSNLTEEQYNHWESVARFFKAYEYSRLVSVFGDVPYFDKSFTDTDFATQYKDRDERVIVMDKVYDDFVFVLDNIRSNDGINVLDRNVAAAFISRLMLFEGSWQKYHGLDQDRAKRYLELAVKAAEIVKNSGKYSFSSDFKSLFGSQSLASNREVIMYRSYEASLNITHAIASYQNGIMSQETAPNLNLIKSFSTIDGVPAGTVLSSNDFSLSKLAINLDPRFEASFDTKGNVAAGSLIYGNKFVSRDGYKSLNAIWNSNTNTSAAPVIRYAEVLLNWVEAKQILAENFGGSPVNQADIDASINAIRKRPLDNVAINKGVKQTAPLSIANIPNDVNRDTDVSPLMWEIRRERRMEFVFEFSRFQDLRRWKKLEKMNFADGSDYYLGPWVDISKDFPTLLTDPAKSSYLSVLKADGTVVKYNGNNATDLVGYYIIPNAQSRIPVQVKNYLSPVGQAQVSDYQTRGYTLTQTKGW